MDFIFTCIRPVQLDFWRRAYEAQKKKHVKYRSEKQENSLCNYGFMISSRDTLLGFRIIIIICPFQAYVTPKRRTNSAVIILNIFYCVM